MQDLLGLGSEARLNTPGTTAGNWSWRLPPGALAAPLAERMRLLNRAFGRA
jgi:4-alpha-glucanotransferase